MTRIWAAREKQIEAAVQCMHGMYGDLQGIVGSSTLPTLEQMDLPRLEGKAHDGPMPDKGQLSLPHLSEEEATC
jgi:hypothetical protein